MSYSPEQVREALAEFERFIRQRRKNAKNATRDGQWSDAKRADERTARLEEAHKVMTAATLRQQAERVDEAMVERAFQAMDAVFAAKWPDREPLDNDEKALACEGLRVALEAALSAQPAMGAAGTGPLSERLRAGIECAPWVLTEVQKLEAKLAAQPAERQEECEPVATVHRMGNCTGQLVYCEFGLRADLPHGTKLYLHPAAPVGVPEVIEEIAKQWDGCMYDAPGETLDIGQCIRAVGKSLAAAPSAPHGVE